jgi:ferric-dicitrate binding protein FerR (iron transport regulator)
MHKRVNYLLLGWFATSAAARRPHRLTRRYIVGAVCAAVCVAVLVWWLNRHLGTQTVNPMNTGA